MAALYSRVRRSASATSCLYAAAVCRIASPRAARAMYEPRGWATKTAGAAAARGRAGMEAVPAGVAAYLRWRSTKIFVRKGV